MIKQSKSGEEEKIPQESLGDSFITHDEKHAWEGQDIEVKSDPLHDTQQGENVLMRVFDFGANPLTLKRDKPSKQQLFDSHAKQIMTMLWSDGLVPVENLNPIIQVSKKKEKYRIIVWCRAKSGVVWADTPHSLQELTKK